MATARWYLTSLQPTITATGYKFVAHTNFPCHLWLHWTLKDPWIHHVPVFTRGLAVRSDIYICFNDWNSVEQEEAYDTEWHTFFVEPWPVCETRWFILQGTIDGLFCPSTSSLYKLHRFTPPIPSEWWICGWPSASTWTPSSSYWFGQTFTPLEDHQLTRVSLSICSDPIYMAYYNTTYIRVHDAPGHVPTGDPISEASYDPRTMPLKPNFDWRYFDMPSVNLLAGHTYALIQAVYKDGTKQYGGHTSLGPVGVEQCPGGHRIYMHYQDGDWHHSWNGNVSNKLIGF